MIFLYILGAFFLFAFTMAVITTLRERAARMDTHDLYYQRWLNASDYARRIERLPDSATFHYPAFRVWKAMTKLDIDVEWVIPIIVDINKDTIKAVKGGILTHIQPGNLSALFIYANQEELSHPVLKYIETDTWRLSFDYKYAAKSHSMFDRMKGCFLSGSVEDFENDLTIIKLLKK